MQILTGTFPQQQMLPCFQTTGDPAIILIVYPFVHSQVTALQCSRINEVLFLIYALIMLKINSEAIQYISSTAFFSHQHYNKLECPTL